MNSIKLLKAMEVVEKYGLSVEKIKKYKNDINSLVLQIIASSELQMCDILSNRIMWCSECPLSGKNDVCLRLLLMYEVIEMREDKSFYRSVSDDERLQIYKIFEDYK